MVNPQLPQHWEKELAVFISRIERELVLINEINLLAKFSGATGSYAAHKAAFPKANWSVFAKKFIKQAWFGTIADYITD